MARLVASIEQTDGSHLIQSRADTITTTNINIVLIAKLVEIGLIPQLATMARGMGMSMARAMGEWRCNNTDNQNNTTYADQHSRWR